MPVYPGARRKTAYRENWIPKLSTGWKPCGRVADYMAK
jgi:hypothetical protein